MTVLKYSKEIKKEERRRQKEKIFLVKLSVKILVTKITTN
jgi:hypothetical protein